MGKKDWCSQKGWDARRRGMKEKETRGRKICLAIFFGFCALFCLVVGGLQLQKASKANAINEDYNDLVVLLAYDSCNFPAFIPDPAFTEELQIANGMDMLNQCGLDVSCYQAGTQWTQVWMANGAINIVQAFNFILLVFGACFFCPRYIGSVCNCLLACCCHASVISLAMTGVLGPFGQRCSYNIASAEYTGNGKWEEDGATYASEARMMLTLAALQGIFCCFQCWCCCLPLYTTPIVGKEKKDKNEDSNKNNVYPAYPMAMQGQPVSHDASQQQQLMQPQQFQQFQQPQFQQPAQGTPVMGYPTLQNGQPMQMQQPQYDATKQNAMY